MKASVKEFQKKDVNKILKILNKYFFIKTQDLKYFFLNNRTCNIF